MKISRKKISRLIEEAIDDQMGLDLDMVIHPMRSGNESVQRSVLVNEMKDNLAQAIWLIEKKDDASKDVAILIEGALRRALTLVGKDGKALPFLEI